MKTYREWGASVNLWANFMAVMQDIQDPIRILILLGDGIEDAGFPEVANLVRTKVDPSLGFAYRARVDAELKRHGMTINGDVLKLIPDNNTAAGWVQFKLTHSQILMNSKKGWIPVDKPYPEAVPGLTVLLLGSIQNTVEEHSSRILLSFLSKYTNELRAESAKLERLVERGENIMPRHIKNLAPLAKRIEDLIKKMNASGINHSDSNNHNPYDYMTNWLGSMIQHIQGILDTEGRPPIRELASLMTYLQ
jgi:hypothetical protein